LNIPRLKKCLASLPRRGFDIEQYGASSPDLLSDYFGISQLEAIRLFYVTDDSKHNSLAGTRARLKAFIARAERGAK
jgi:hypothetical protein